jgi:serine/threonine protein kinase
MVGRTLEGRYTLVGRLGAGSMGTVYRAKQHAMGREVAIKILRGDRATDETAKARFMREARANSLLASPNTVTVFDFGQSESGEFYLAMELLEGENLGQRLARVGRMPVAVAVDIARQALRSLSEAHAKGIIHRDLKPDNVFFARVLTSANGVASAGAHGPHGAHEEIVKVLDFGIAKTFRTEDEPMGVVETQAGTVFGTPRYMSPEQAQGKPLGPTTDLYSLGVILYQMLTGRPPFTDNDAVVVMARHIKSDPKLPSEVAPDANIPRELEDVVMRALSKTPAERQASADVFAGELLAALEAQSATSSGVRSALTNAAGIRLPESMRPRQVTLPSVRRGGRFSRGGLKQALLFFGVIGVAAAAIAFFALQRAGRDSSLRVQTTPEPGPSPTAASSTAPAERRASADLGVPAGSPESSDPSPEASAPPAPPAANAPKTQTKASSPRSKPAVQPHSTSKTPPATSTTSKYGVFE